MPVIRATITRDAFGAKGRSVEADRRPVSALPPSTIPEGDVWRARARGPAAGCRSRGNTCSSPAVATTKSRRSICRPRAAGLHGALTYFLCQELRRATLGHQLSRRVRDVARASTPRTTCSTRRWKGGPIARFRRRRFHARHVRAHHRARRRGGPARRRRRAWRHGRLDLPRGPQGAHDAEGPTSSAWSRWPRFRRHRHRPHRQRTAPAVAGARAFKGPRAFGDQRLTATFAVSDDADRHVPALPRVWSSPRS